MKKFFLMGAAVCAIFMMSSCKSKESAYKKAYEKAKAQQTENTTTVTPPVQQGTTTQTVTPVTPAPVNNDYSNVAVRNENVTVVEGSPLKQYGVVVASVTIKSNGAALMQKLAGQGYNSCLAQAQVNGQTFYRVVACSYDTKADAAQKRAQLEGQYPGAWLLYKK
ncbi:MAG: SPOR domain-containing protein [Prevotellaceae bacterium]|nr:SPOR domain-containing protein [Prevotellaceae bacterium]